MPLTKAILSARELARGVSISITIAMAASFVSEHYGGPTLLYALLVGMAFHFLSHETSAAKGIDFTVRTILRIGVALLGARISLAQIIELGLTPIAIVLGGVCATLLFGRLAAPRLNLSSRVGVLTGGAVAICGASAALAISAVLPKDKDNVRDTLFTVVAVTVFSTVAMILYPVLARVLGLPHFSAGVLLGATIHDVAQVVAAGYLISDEAGLVATYVKLLRVSMLLPVVLTLSWAYASAENGAAPARRLLLPSFLVAFVLLAAANSIGMVPPLVSSFMAQASRWCLVCAIAALGMKTSLQELAKVGWRPIGLIAAETVFLLVLVLLALKLTGHL